MSSHESSIDHDPMYRLRRHVRVLDLIAEELGDDAHLLRIALGYLVGCDTLMAERAVLLALHTDGRHERECPLQCPKHGADV